METMAAAGVKPPLCTLATTLHEMPGIAVLAVCLPASKSIAYGVFGSVKVRDSCAFPDHCLIRAKRPSTRLRLERRPRRKVGQHATASRRPHSSYCILRYFVPAGATMASADIVADDAILSKVARVKFVSGPRTVGPSWASTSSTADTPSRAVLYHRMLQKALSATKGPRRAFLSSSGLCGRMAPGGTAPIAWDTRRKSDETDALVDCVQGRPPTLRRTCRLQFSLNMSNGLGPGGKPPRDAPLRLGRTTLVHGPFKTNHDGCKHWCQPVPCQQRRSFRVLLLPTNLPPSAVSDYQKCCR
jgi:hypothetical protein